MNNDVFALPYLGNVTLEHRLIDYDGPFLFTIRSSNGGRYLGFYASAEDDLSTYWYSAISDERYKNLLRGKLPVRSVFEDPEQGYVLEVEWRGSEFAEAMYKRASTLDADALPEPDFLIDAEGAVVPSGVVASANFVAMQLQRLVARIVFDRKDGAAPATVVASTIRHLQGVIDAIAFSRTREPTDRGAVPNYITEKTSLLLVPVFAGSLGIELVAETPSDMIGSVVEDSFEGLFKLVEAGDDKEKLRPLFAQFKSRTANHYRKLMDSWAEVGTDVSIETGVPRDKGEQIVYLSRQHISDVVQALYLSAEEEPEIDSFDAELIGYNKRVKSFEVKRLSNGATYKGKVTGAALQSAANATIGKIYSVKIVSVMEFDVIADKGAPQMELVELKDLRRQPARQLP